MRLRARWRLLPVGATAVLVLSGCVSHEEMAADAEGRGFEVTSVTGYDYAESASVLFGNCSGEFYYSGKPRRPYLEVDLGDYGVLKLEQPTVAKVKKIEATEHCFEE